MITDISGKTSIRKEVTLEPGTNQIKLNRFDQSGIYLITIQTASERITSKLMVVE